GSYRRANLLDIAVCIWPFLLPYCLPTILAANATAAGLDAGLPRLAPLTAGLHNVYSWALLVVLVVAVTTGAGRAEGPPPER
ncbi:MAG: sodium:proton antiporter, partial [Vicinamibacteria bacterium]